MAEKPESRFGKKINKKIKELKPKYSIQKMSSVFNRGMFDTQYTSYEGDLWVEYKHFAKQPKRPVDTGVSPLQNRWGLSRFELRQDAVVVLGVGQRRGLIIVNPDRWMTKIDPIEWEHSMLIDSVAEWIVWAVNRTSYDKLLLLDEMQDRPFGYLP